MVLFFPPSTTVLVFLSAHTVIAVDSDLVLHQSTTMSAKNGRNCIKFIIYATNFLTVVNKVCSEMRR